jgi:hypothetical protein
LKTVVLLLFTIYSIIFISSCNKVILDNNYEKISLYITNNDKYEKHSEIEDQKIINNIINTINTSDRKKLDEIVFERGPDGIIKFEKKEHITEFKVFTENGHIVTKDFYIKSDIDIKKLFNL